MKLKIFCAFLTLMSVCISYAQIFTNNGITYEIINVDGKSAVAVTSSATGSYTGSLTIPPDVDYEGQTYTTHSINDLGDSPELRLVSIPASIMNIKGTAFEKYTGIKELRLEDGDQAINLNYLKYVPSGFGKGTFSNCPLKALYIGRKLNYKGGNAYGYGPFCQNPNLEKIEFGDKISFIDGYLCYNNTGLSNVSIPNGVTAIGAYAFANTSLMNVEIPSSVTDIKANAFYGISTLKTLILKDGLNPLSIGTGNSSYNSMFSSANIDYLYIGREIIGSKSYYPMGVYPSENSVIEIGDYVRYIRDHSINITATSNSALDRAQKLIFGKDVSVIGNEIFEKCGSKLTSIVCKSELPPIVMNPSTMLSNVDVNVCKLYVPKHSVKLYKADSYWNKFFVIEEISDDYPDLGDKVINRIYLQLAERINLSHYLSNSHIVHWSNSNDKVISFDSTNSELEALGYGESTLSGFDSSGKIVVLFDLFVCPSVTIEHGSGAIYKHPVIYNSTPILYIAASEGQEITGITHDGEDITDLVLQNDGKYAVKSPIKDNSIINITIKDDSSMSQIESSTLASSNIRFLVDGRSLTIKGADTNSKIIIYNMSGLECYNGVNKSIILPAEGLYLIKIQTEDVISLFKINVR